MCKYTISEIRITQAKSDTRLNVYHSSKLTNWVNGRFNLSLSVRICYNVTDFLPNVYFKYTFTSLFNFNYPYTDVLLAYLNLLVKYNVA